MKVIKNGLKLNVENHFNKRKVLVVTRHHIMELSNLLVKNVLKNSIEKIV